MDKPYDRTFIWEGDLAMSKRKTILRILFACSVCPMILVGFVWYISSEAFRVGLRQGEIFIEWV